MSTTTLENQALISITNDMYIVLLYEERDDGSERFGWRADGGTWARKHFDEGSTNRGAFGSLCKKGLCWSEGQRREDLLGLSNSGRAHIEALIKTGTILEDDESGCLTLSSQ